MQLEENKVKKAVSSIGNAIKDSDLEQLAKVVETLPSQGLNVKNILGISDSMTESMYGQAYSLYNTGKYKEAKELFRLLVMVGPQEPKYLLGLAACLHMMKEYLEALNIYIMCAVADPTSPIPHYHASDCYLKINEKVSALVALEMAVNNAKDLAPFKSLKDKALLTIETLKKELKIKS